jgi:hypothetical protein
MCLHLYIWRENSRNPEIFCLYISDLALYQMTRSSDVTEHFSSKNLREENKMHHLFQREMESR